MAKVSDKLALKLQLNSALQARATLETQLREKEEIITKFQTETLRKGQSYKQELKVLLEKKNRKEKNLIAELKGAVKSLKSCEAKLSSDLQASESYRKYQRSKKITEVYKRNEDGRRQTLFMINESSYNSEVQYKALKNRAQTQLGISNQEVQAMREHYKAKIQKLRVNMKRLEMKVSSLTYALDQKTKECSALYDLRDKALTGYSVNE